MAYSKQNFQNGQILNAANLEAMENGIIAGQGAKNLLVNSDFRNPIDIDNKIGTKNVNPCFTRWNIIRASSNTTTQIIKTDNGIRVYKNGGVARFCQYCNYNLLDKTVSYAIGTTEGIFVGSCSVGTSSVFTRIGTHTGYLSVYYSSTDKKTVFSLYFNDNSEDAIDLYWAALYEGAYTKETLPNYVPNGKHIEIINCGVSLQPHNLLDNSYFTNPVNQRGQTSYPGEASKLTYTIDRWNIWDTHAKTEVTASGLKITGIDVMGYIAQIFEKPNKMIGKTYTLAAGMSDGTVICGTATVPSTTQTEEYYISAIPSSDTTPGLRLQVAGNLSKVRFQFSVKPGKTCTIAWAALYEGSYDASTLPAYQPKGYAAELAECQRYYYQSWTGSIGANGIITRQAMALQRLASVELPCTMRTTPTITLYTSNGQAGAVKGWLDSVVVSGMTVVYANSKSFIPAHEGNGLTIGNWYGFHYTASADL